MDNELEVISFERVLTPSLVVDDIYYPDNEYSKKKECALKEQIASIAAEMEPWEVEVARRYAYGETVNALIKSLKKNSAKITACLNTHKTQEIIALWRSVIIYQQGPNEAQRKNMLWRIAIDNEKTDPKEATKAMAEMNRMEAEKNGKTRPNIEIIINNEMLPRTSLDG